MMGKQVMVIEPSRTTRKLLEIFLQRDGHPAVLFDDYAKAIKALSLPGFQIQPPDLVFVALHPDVKDSYRLLAYLRRQRSYANTTIIAMITQEESTHIELQSVVQAAQAITLIKPVRIQDVLTLVSSAPEHVVYNLFEATPRKVR